MKTIAFTIAAIVGFVVLAALPSFADLFGVAVLVWFVYVPLRWAWRCVRRRRSHAITTAAYRRPF